MDKRIIISVVAALLVAVVFVPDADGEFVSRKPLRKTWWAKRINDDLYVAGRLSDIQIKYASEDGFRSVVSLYNHASNGNFGGRVLPPTKSASDIAERLSGLEFRVLCNEDTDDDDVQKSRWRRPCWKRWGTVIRFGHLLRKLPKPVLFYSNTGYSASSVSLAWLVRQTFLGKVSDPDDITSPEHFFVRASGLGYDFSQDEDLKRLVGICAGGKAVSKVTSPDLTVPEWHTYYWWAKPVYMNWFIAGQVWSEHLELINNLGFNVLMNSRLGPISVNPQNGQQVPTQEEVTLLNINNDCSTYGCEGGRQSTEQLLAHRIDPNKPVEYVGQDNPDGLNYWAKNPLEFGDDIGYNETLEKEALTDVDFEYLHTPIGAYYGFQQYESTWQSLHQEGNILAHCRSAYRAAVIVLLTVGKHVGADMDWVLDKAKLIGFDFTEENDAIAWSIFKSAFDQQEPTQNTFGTSQSRGWNSLEQF